MPLNAKGEKILASMKKSYGADAKKILFASKNKGTITNIDEACEKFNRNLIERCRMEESKKKK